MNKDEFWRLVERARALGQSTRESVATVLAAEGAQKVRVFEQALESRLKESDRGEIWAAALLLNGGYCSDDCFLYFRWWLVMQGRKVFEAALKNPDSLASVPVRYSDDVPVAQEEELALGIGDADAIIGGRKRASPVAIQRLQSFEDFKPKWDWREFSKDDFLKEKLPKLWARFGSIKQRADIAAAPSADSPSCAEAGALGVICVGDRLRHRDYGEGVVLRFENAIGPIAVLKFLEGEKTMHIDAAHFRR